MQACRNRTSDGPILVPLHSNIPFFIPPYLTEQVSCRAVILSPPGQDMVHSFGVFTKIQQTPQNEIVHSFRTLLKTKMYINIHVVYMYSKNT